SAKKKGNESSEESSEEDESGGEEALWGSGATVREKLLALVQRNKAKGAAKERKRKGKAASTRYDDAHPTKKAPARDEDAPARHKKKSATVKPKKTSTGNGELPAKKRKKPSAGDGDSAPPAKKRKKSAGNDGKPPAKKRKKRSAEAGDDAPSAKRKKTSAQEDEPAVPAVARPRPKLRRLLKKAASPAAPARSPAASAVPARSPAASTAPARSVSPTPCSPAASAAPASQAAPARPTVKGKRGGPPGQRGAALRASEYDSLNEAAQCRDEDAQWIDDEDDAVKMKRVSEARKNRMKVRRRVVQEQWDAEDAGVQGKIREIVKKEEIVQPPETDTTDDKRTPEAYQLSIDEVLQVAEMFLGELYKMTGWMGILVVGGPVPRAEGELGVTAVPFGKTPEGLDFEKWHPSWKKRAIYKEGEGNTDVAQPAPGADGEMTAAAPAPKKAKSKKKTGKSSETVAPAAPPAAVSSKPPRRPQKKTPETPKPPRMPTAPPTTTDNEADGEEDYPPDLTPNFSPDDATPSFLSQSFSHSQDFSPSHSQSFSPSHSQNFSPHSQDFSPSHLQRSSSQEDFPLMPYFALSQDFGHGFGLQSGDFASRPQDFSQSQEFNGSQSWPDWRGEHLESVATKVATDVYTFPTGFGPDTLEGFAPETSAFAAPTPPRPRPTPRLRQGSSPSTSSFSFERAGQYRHTHLFGSPLHATGGTNGPGTPSTTRQEASSTPPSQPQAQRLPGLTTPQRLSSTPSRSSPLSGPPLQPPSTPPRTTALPATALTHAATPPRPDSLPPRLRPSPRRQGPSLAPQGKEPRSPPVYPMSRPMANVPKLPKFKASPGAVARRLEAARAAKKTSKKKAPAKRKANGVGEQTAEPMEGEQQQHGGGEEQRAQPQETVEQPVFVCSSTNNNAARLREEKAAEAEKKKVAAARKAENMRLHNSAGNHDLYITQGRARPSRSIQPSTSRGEVVSLHDRNKALQQKAAADDDALLKALVGGKKRKGHGDLEEENSAPPAKKRVFFLVWDDEAKANSSQDKGGRKRCRQA
ncbi:hypothetical protein DFH09DRAFT_1117524, partial [Mycena vulgaris]